MPPLRPMTGKVALDPHPNMPNNLCFRVHNEPNLVNHDQLPQFFPRTQWPNPAIVERRRAYNLLTTDDIDWSDAQQVRVFHDDVDDIYPNLTPMEPFNNATDTYDNTPWLTHVAYMHGALNRCIVQCQPLQDLEMCALLRTISYGMYHTMTFFHPWHATGLNARARTRRAGQRYQTVHATEFGLDMKASSFLQDRLSQQDYKNRMMGRRWIVVPIRYEHQWAMTIFDRQEGHLYIFDCDTADDREERVEVCTHHWARFWNWLGMPWSFLYFAPAVTERPGLRDSGLAAVMWVMLNLRNQVGRVMQPNNARVIIRDILILPLDPNMTLQQSSFPLHDWVPDGCANSQRGIQGVETVLRVLICNELGLRNNSYMNRRFGSPQRTPIRLLDAAATYMINNARFPPNVFWTGHGGAQFCLPERSSIWHYSDQRERSHTRPAGNNRVVIRTTHQELTTRRRPPQQEAVAWPQGTGYTHNQPYGRPGNGIRLMVTGIDELDDISTAAARRIRIGLRNSLSRLGQQRIQPPLDMEIRGARVQQQANGVRALVFNIDVWFGGDARMSLPFSIAL